LKFKIITVHLNNSNGFDETFYSVKQFIESHIEIDWIIKDGLSEISILNHIKETIKSLPRTQVISSKDLGVYDAMNYSLSLIEDEDVVLFLNAGDRLSDAFIRNYQSETFNMFDLYYSDTLTGHNQKLLVAPDKVDFAYLISKTINHQSLIIKSKWLKKYHFKTNFSIVADWVQLFEILKFEKVSIKKLNYPISIYEGGGISEKQDALRIKQREEYLKSNYSDWELDTLKKIARLRQRNWYNFIIKALDSPRRSKLINLFSKVLE